MNDAQMISAVLNCQLSDLKLDGIEEPSKTALETKEPWRLKVTIDFSDTANNEISNLLMTQRLTVRTTFYARPLDEGHEVELGNVVLTTESDILTYTPVLVIADPKTTALVDQKCYQIGVLVRVGTSAFCIPSLMRGCLEGMVLQIGEPIETPEPIKELVSTVSSATTTKTSRRKATPVERGGKP